MDDEINVEIENLNLEEALEARHKKERKELQAKVQALKKSASKGDKKSKKKVLDEIIQLELELNKRHTEELNNCEKEKSINEVINENDNANSNTDTPSQQRVSKAQKRRDKKAKEEREKQIEILAQEELNKNGPRMMEIKSIKNLLKARGLLLHPISSDGDCLYNAIKHQLSVTGRSVLSTQILRQQTADYISTNKDSLIFYMTNLTTGDCLTDAEFDQYCDAIRNTPAWGGQIEIKALSNVLKCPIEVLQATGPPTIQGEDDFSGPNLVIAYHRLMYSLGEHYNSTKPMTGVESSEDESNNALEV